MKMKINLNNLDLLKYRLKNNDIILKRKIKIVTIFFLSIILILVLAFSKPFELIKVNLQAKTRSYIQRNKDNIYFSKNNKKNNSNKKLNDGNYNNSNLPIAGTITSNYGMRSYPSNGMHTGIDISGKHHDNVRVIQDGVVSFAGSQRGYGNCIEVKHSNYYSFYAHLSKINVNVGDNVSRGDIIAIEGGDPRSDPNPGFSTGHHLHFEIRTAPGYGNDINPLPYLWN